MKLKHAVQHQPDFDNLRRTLLREGPPGPVPFIELFADPGMMETMLGEKFPIDLRQGLATQSRSQVTTEELLLGKQVLDMILRFCHETGYDYVFMWTGLNFPRSNYSASTDTAALSNWPNGQRYWQDETTGPIQNWADFESYRWPKPENISYAALEYLNVVMPEGMKISVNLGGIFENASWLMGFQSFAYALYDQPDLIEAIFARVGDLTVTAAAHAVTIDNVGMVFLGDDLGYNKGTLVSPDVLRKYVYPQQKRLVDIAHQAGKPFLLHSCGNLEKVMDDLIDEVGIDAKHSFEDVIMPVEEIHRRWGDRVSVLGGVDMDLLGRGSEEQVRVRTREILDACAGKGTGYCLGTGNSAANYIPKRNYLAMLDEGRRWNREHFGVP